MTSAAVRAPSLREVRVGLAEVLHPIAALQAELAAGRPVAVDAEAVQRRVRAGRPAFDALEVLHRAGDLQRPFQRAAAAFQRAGLASHEMVLAARQQPAASIVHVAASWIAGEPLPRQEPRRLAQRAAAIVVGAILRGVAESVMPAVRTAAHGRATCPACGSAPEFSVSGPKGRKLTCARCDTTWRTDQAGCLGCGECDAPTVSRIPSSDIGYDLLVCNGCGRYVKERTRRGGSDLLVERALTSQLDAAAERRGLRL